MNRNTIQGYFFDCISGKECAMVAPVSFKHAHLHEMHFSRASFWNADYHQDKRDRRELFHQLWRAVTPLFSCSFSLSPNLMLFCFFHCFCTSGQKGYIYNWPQTYRTLNAEAVRIVCKKAQTPVIAFNYPVLLGKQALAPESPGVCP